MFVDDEAIIPVEGVILVGNAEAIIPVVVFYIRPIIRWVILRGMSNDTRCGVDIGRNNTRRYIRSTRNRIDIRRRSCPSYHAKQCRYPMKKQQERVLISFEDALAPARGIISSA